MGVVVRQESLFCLVFWWAACLRIGGWGPPQIGGGSLFDGLQRLDHGLWQLEGVVADVVPVPLAQVVSSRWGRQSLCNSSWKGVIA